VVLVVSEETQEISIAMSGSITVLKDEEALTEELHKIFIPSDQPGFSWRSWLEKASWT
jgi:hypothetical protein